MHTLKHGHWYNIDKTIGYFYKGNTLSKFQIRYDKENPRIRNTFKGKSLKINKGKIQLVADNGKKATFHVGDLFTVTFFGEECIYGTDKLHEEEHRVHNGIKKCWECHDNKDVTEFPKNTHRCEDGYEKTCKECKDENRNNEKSSRVKEFELECENIIRERHPYRSLEPQKPIKIKGKSHPFRVDFVMDGWLMIECDEVAHAKKRDEDMPRQIDIQAALSAPIEENIGRNLDEWELDILYPFIRIRQGAFMMDDIREIDKRIRIRDQFINKHTKNS